MEECLDSMISVMIPFTIFNLMGTCLIVLLSKVLEPSWYGHNTIPKDLSSTELNRALKEEFKRALKEGLNNSLEDDSTSSGSSVETSECEEISGCLSNKEDNSEDVTNIQIIREDILIVKDNGPDKCEESHITDDDLIAHVRESLRCDSTYGPCVPIDEMTKTIISMAKDISSKMESAKHIPDHEKLELTNILKDIPELITKITHGDDKIAKLLSEVPKLMNKLSIMNDLVENPSDDHSNDSDFLMQTLEALHMDSPLHTGLPPYTSSSSYTGSPLHINSK